MKRRPYIPYPVKLATALLQLGLDPATARLNHKPPLALRVRHEDGSYTPAANDPRYLEWLSPEADKIQTFGRPATTAGSDIHAIRKVDRLNEAEAEFRSRLLAPGPDRKASKRSTWPKRKLRSRNSFKDRRKA